MSAWSVTNPVENVSVSTDQLGPRRSGSGDLRSETGEVGVAIGPHDVVLHGGDAGHGARLLCERGEATDRLVDDVERLAARKPDQMVTELAAGVHHLTGDRHHTTSLRQLATEGSSRRRRDRRDGCRR